MALALAAWRGRVALGLLQSSGCPASVSPSRPVVWRSFRTCRCVAETSGTPGLTNAANALRRDVVLASDKMRSVIDAMNKPLEGIPVQDRPPMDPDWQRTLVPPELRAAEEDINRRMQTLAECTGCAFYKCPASPLA